MTLSLTPPAASYSPLPWLLGQWGGVCRMSYFSLKNGFPIKARTHFSETARRNATNNCNLYRNACIGKWLQWDGGTGTQLCSCSGAAPVHRRHVLTKSPSTVPRMHAVSEPCAQLWHLQVLISAGGHGGWNQMEA